MPTAVINGTSIYYVTAGTGLPLVFVHEHGLMHTMFKPQMDCFSQWYQVIACDLRGNGQSGRLTQSPYEVMDTQCHDLIVLLNELHVRAAVFIGVAYGGLLVQRLAREYPNRVAGIVVADSFSGEISSSAMKTLELAAAYCSAATYYAPSDWLLHSLRISYRRWSLPYPVIRRSMQKKRPGEWYKQRLAMARYGQSSGCAAEISCPALFISGDTTELYVRYAHEKARQLPHAGVEIIPDSMLPSNLCQPELFNRCLQRFLDAIITDNRKFGG